MTMRFPKQQAHFIDGAWSHVGVGDVVSENPATGEEIWCGMQAEEHEVERAVAAASKAFQHWSQTRLGERQVFLKNYANVLQAHADELALAIHQETGKPLWESKTEVAGMVGKINVSLKAYDQRTGSHSQLAAATGIQTNLAHRAHGVFVVLGPYNFPGHLPNGHIIPALLAGNTIVFKPSEFTPWVAELMLQCWVEAGLPAGVLNLLHGGRETGTLLVKHRDIAGVLFTGSSKTGTALHQLMAGKPEKLLALEMGGNNPLLVEAVSHIDAAVYMIIQSAFVSAGQRCTCARRLILMNSENNQLLLQRLIKVASLLVVGSDANSFMGTVIHNAAADQLLDAQAMMVTSGGKPLLAMQRVKSNTPFLTPGIIDMTQAQCEDEEYFGPLLQVIWVDSLQEGIELANATRFGLAAGLLSDDKEVWATFYQQIRAGIVNWNRPLTGASSAAPFGGLGASGNHRPSAFYAADYSAFPVASLCSDQLALPETLSPGIVI